MSSTDTGKLTALVALARQGDAAAASEVFARLNSQLRAIAKRVFASEAPGNTLQPTAIVNEAWLKLQSADGGLNVSDVESRSHFCAIAAKIMRQVLVDHARGKKAVKRGGGQATITIDQRDQPVAVREVDTVALHDALERLEAIRPRAAQIVELRHFGGCTIPETAMALGVSPETVKNDWRFARAWLRRELSSDA